MSLPIEATATRIAIVHEWLDQPGGAENVVRQMLRTFPGADVWSLWSKSPGRDVIPAEVNTTWLAKTPLAGHKAVTLPLMPLTWRNLPRRDYDIIITSTYAFAHLARFRGCHATTFHYVYSPGRYWWNPSLDGRGTSRVANFPRAVLKSADRRYARRHQHVAAISCEIQRRITQHWGIDSRVLYPPVDTEFFSPGTPESDPPFAEYLLGISRWIPYKRLDLVIETGNRLGVPVVIAGAGPEEVSLRTFARQMRVPVRFEVSPNRQRVRDLYRGARAVVFPAHEDFGIVPVEATACGTPVVGLAIGGSLETVVDGVTGRLVDAASSAALAEGVESLPSIDPAALSTFATKFSAPRFRAQLLDWIGSAT